MMPRFFKDMPKPKKGKYTASVIRVTSFRSREVWSKSYNGRLRAYFMARFRALWEDLTTPSYDGQLGINWNVKETGAINFKL